MKKSGLDLSSLKLALKGSESGPVIVPGKPEESPLYEMVRDGKMPAGKSGRLTPPEVEVIRRWIAAGAGSRSVTDKETAAAAISQHDVIPILLRRCTVCHALRQQEGSLDLRTRATMIRGGKSGPAMIPGKPEESLLIKKIRAGDMPPRQRVVEASVKPIEPSEIEVLARWIELGAPEVAAEPDVATASPDALVSEQDRNFWSFRPPRSVIVPALRPAPRLHNPIDAFILQKLEEHGLTLSPEADPLTLLRRVTFDLTGLPPEPEEVRAFLADRDPNAYERVVDRLLASPRYGERWARHWLDAAGYADSEGKREQELFRPSAYRYRDYVIRSFNADKPYDRFLLEQIAGDELVDYEHAATITPEIYDNLVATGFLRMAPDPTWANITNFVPDRLDVISDEIDVFSSTVLGLTLKCARCHSHKFDPIPQRDYYRLVDIFKGAFDEYDWMRSGWQDVLSSGQRFERQLTYVTSEERHAWEEHNRQLERETAALKAVLDQREESLRKRCLKERLSWLPEALRNDVCAVLANAAGKPKLVPPHLGQKLDELLRIDRKELKKADADFNKMCVETERRLRDLESKRLPEPAIRALWDRGEPSPTYILRGGDYLRPGRLVGPGVPSVLTDGKTPFEVKPPWPGAHKTGRRLALARWLTKPDHPLTARVLVNRLWKHHFGTGIVKTLANFGKTGAAPTHPELLDWLAREFVHRGWSIKAMQRLLVTSATYRQTSAVSPACEKLDPENTLYSRMPLVRMDAEALYDTLLAVAGRLDRTPFGPADPVNVRSDGLVTPVGTERGWRRSIYVRQQRKQLPTVLENFDLPQMNPNCLERRVSTVAPQALHLMNDDMVHRLADSFAHRVWKTSGADPAQQVERVYLIALGRPPSGEEKEVGRIALARLTERWAEHLAGTSPPDQSLAAQRALATYCHAIVNSASFVYLD